MSKLVLHLEDATTLDIPLDSERITIGRRADNDVCLPNLAVSGEHAAVVTILDDSFLEDLGSTNGTLVNGSAIVKHFLRDGDEIDIGRHTFVYCVDPHEMVNSIYIARGMAGAAGDLGEKVPSAETVARSRRSGDGGRSQAGATPRTAVVSGKTRGPKNMREPQSSDAIEAAPAASTAPAPKPSLKILVGSQAGRDISLTRERTTIGRAGVQVALISQAGDTFRLKALEGERAPLVNGRAATDGGVDLSPGDRIEIAGSTLEFVYHP